MLKHKEKQQNNLDIWLNNSTFAPAFENKRAFSSVGLEHLPYKQRVGRSNPSTPTHHANFKSKGGFQSGQMGQTVNLLLLASVVRIHHHPLLIKRLLLSSNLFFVHLHYPTIILTTLSHLCTWPNVAKGGNLRRSKTWRLQRLTPSFADDIAPISVLTPPDYAFTSNHHRIWFCSEFSLSGQIFSSLHNPLTDNHLPRHALLHCKTAHFAL